MIDDQEIFEEDEEEEDEEGNEKQDSLEAEIERLIEILIPAISEIELEELGRDLEPPPPPSDEKLQRITTAIERGKANQNRGSISGKG